MPNVMPTLRYASVEGAHVGVTLFRQDVELILTTATMATITNNNVANPQ